MGSKYIPIVFNCYYIHFFCSSFNVQFLILFLGLFYSLDLFSLFHRLFIKQYRIKNIWSPPGIEPRTACIAHKHSPTELWQPASKQTLQFCVYTVELLCYSLTLNRPMKILFFQRFLLFIDFFYSSNLSLHNFFFFFFFFNFNVFVFEWLWALMHLQCI